jgi:hypothetical protein
MNGYQWYPWFSSNLPVTGRHQDSSIFQRSAWYKLKEIKKTTHNCETTYCLKTMHQHL